MNKSELNQIEHCEVCGELELLPVLDLGNQPMCDDLVSFDDNRVCDEYPIEILFCNNCLTAHQKYQIDKHILFPNDYHYRSKFTSDVLDGMKELVDNSEKYVSNYRNKSVVDVGCNDGSLLDYFKRKGASTIGVEPTDASNEARDKGHRIYAQYFDCETAEDILTTHGKIDIIVFTNVFAHIENLEELLKALSIILKETSILIIENHYLDSVLNKCQFDTFYHEHPRTYSCTSFYHIAKKLGRSVIDVEFPSRYGGNIRVYIGKSNDKFNTNDQVIKYEKNNMLMKFDKMRLDIKSWENDMRYKLTEYVDKYGPLKAKAFPGRASILIKQLKIDETTIDAVYEKPGSLKIGNYVPGTRIPIYSDNDLVPFSKLNEPILNLAWHIKSEIHDYLRNQGFSGEVLDIFGKEYISDA